METCFKNREKEEKKDDPPFIVFSVAIQPIISLSARYKLTPEVTARKLVTFFKKLGADLVLDLKIAEDLSILEQQQEFLNRYRERKEGQKHPGPILSSSCPGWICYAEKTHGSWILNNISRVKSAQQIMGSLVKDFIPAQQGVRADRVYHISVMPCFDKKLEASREDFYSDVIECRDVDCVVTSLEIQEMIENEDFKVDFQSLEETDLDTLVPGPAELIVNTGIFGTGWTCLAEVLYSKWI